MLLNVTSKVKTKIAGGLSPFRGMRATYAGTAEKEGLSPPPPLFSKARRFFERYKMSSSFVNCAKAPVARDNRHFSFGRFVIRAAIN